MGISFKYIPGDLRSPGTYLEVDPGQANGATTIQRALILAQKISAGTGVANIPEAIQGIVDGRTLFGAGSVGALMIERYRQRDPDGELWAVATTLRIVLIENLRRFAVRIEHSQTDRHHADALADRLLGTDTGVAEPASPVLAGWQGPVSDAFAVQFVRRLHGHSDGIAQALTWLEARLAERASSTHAAIAAEQERQIGATVTVRNIITSMRVISEIDWSDLFEQMSPVDDLLNKSDTYRAMDFASRNFYRTAVENLARSSPLSEIEVAARALHAAGKARCADGSLDPRRGDPGYYLVAAGRTALEAEIGYRAPIRVWPRRLSRKLGLAGYGSVILIVAALVLLSFVDVPALGSFTVPYFVPVAKAA
jgi:cyclic beta-1,2-glucan synthetase